MGEWPKLTRVLEDFAASHGMSFRNSNQSDPNVLESLDLSLCNEQGLLITANDHRWATQGYAPIMADWKVPVSLFDLTEGASWRRLSHDLFAALNSEWPGKVQVRLFGDRLIPLSPALPQNRPPA